LFSWSLHFWKWTELRVNKRHILFTTQCLFLLSISDAFKHLEGRWEYTGIILSRTWWCTPVTPGLERLRQEDYQFEDWAT
jgi:hypothetical protein